MNQVIYTFDPTHQQDQTTFLLALFFALGALAAMFFLLRKPAADGNRNRRLLGAMLLFFVFLIAGSTAFFSRLFMQKLGPVTLYENAIETPYGIVDYPNIRNAYIHIDKQPSMINPSITRKSTRMLLIETKDGSAHVLPEANYPIQEILGKMKELIVEKNDE